MPSTLISKFALTVVVFASVSIVSRVQADHDWEKWRGPHATGVAEQSNPPTEWSESKNIKWKVKLPGGGHAAPIISGDRVYLLSAAKTEKEVKSSTDDGAEKDEASKGSGFDGPSDTRDALQAPGDRPRRGGRGGPRGGRRGPGGRGERNKPTHVYQFAVTALDRATGKTVWHKVVREEVPHESGHQDASQASASPLIDGDKLYAHFGSRGLYCLDLDGNVLWEKDLGEMHTRNEFGEGSSPAIAGDVLVVNWDHEGDSFIVGLDKKTGAEKWRTARDEPTSWVTPLVVDNGGSLEVIVTGSNRVRGYDAQTGKVNWECGGLGTNCIPTPVIYNGLVYAMSGHRNEALLAIRYQGAKSDITDSDRIVWRRDKGIPYVPSPLLYEDTLYLLEKNKGILYVVDAKTGEDRYERQRLEDIDGVYASPVGASGHVYIVGRNGTTCVLEHGNAFKQIATNKLDDEINASPAIAGNELYLRGTEYLYCIASK